MKKPVFRLLASLLAAGAAALGASAQQLGYESGMTDLTVPLQSGFYQGAGTLVGDVPDNSHTWTHLIVGRHSNTGNNHQLQIASTYATNDRLFFRKLAASGAQNTAWRELATRGANTFEGSQTIGNWNSGSSGSSSNGSSQLLVSGQHNQGVNQGSSGGTYKLKIEGYNNDGPVVYPIYVRDENQFVDFWLRNRPTQSGVPSMYFAGNFGIGTSTPDYKLDVNGTLRAKEIVVSTNWADFVFEEDYRLPPLSEVESHIAAHGRLPGVPSATAVQRDGLKVAEAQTIMMQKIEELTLYLLEMKRENESLRDEMDRLRQSLSNR